MTKANLQQSLYKAANLNNEELAFTASLGSKLQTLTFLGEKRKRKSNKYINRSTNQSVSQSPINQSALQSVILVNQSVI